MQRPYTLVIYTPKNFPKPIGLSRPLSRAELILGLAGLKWVFEYLGMAVIDGDTFPGGPGRYIRVFLPSGVEILRMVPRKNSPPHG